LLKIETLELTKIYNNYLKEKESINKSEYQKKNPNKYYRASGAGHCFKKHWYTINGYEGKEVDERSRRLLRLGTIVHEDIQKAIEWDYKKTYEMELPEGAQREFGYTTYTEYAVVIEELNVMGSADIVVIEDAESACIVDIKTTHSYKWKLMFGRAGDVNPGPMYQLQLGTYALGVCEQEEIPIENISMSLMYYKKDDSVMKAVQVNNAWINSAKQYWKSLNETLEMVKDESDLPRNTLNVPNERWECKYCQFEPICN